MVATRRGARTGVDKTKAGVDTGSVQPKKTTRKAAAKPAVPAPAKTTSRSRTTRSKKTENTDQDSEDETKEDPSEVEPNLPQKKTAANKTQISRLETTKPPVSKLAASKAPTKTTRVINTRTKKTEVLQDKTQDPPPLTRSRATRTTRGTTAKESAKILSPKKITQVSKAPLKATRSTATKSKKQAPTKAALPIRPSRRRGVSDENADVADFSQNEEDELSIAVRPKQQKPLSSRKSPDIIEIPSDSEMSSRPSTPTDSPKLDCSRAEEEVDELDEPGSEVDHSDSDENEKDDEDESEDELCGPKTPMRRCSPREAARYSGSPQRNARHSNNPSPKRTPLRRAAVRIQRGYTPQTQRPYFKRDIPTFDAQPMTVARAADRAMVFPELTTSVANLKSQKSPVQQTQDHEQLTIDLGDGTPESLTAILEAETHNSQDDIINEPDAKSNDGSDVNDNADNDDNDDFHSQATDTEVAPFEKAQNLDIDGDLTEVDDETDSRLDASSPLGVKQSGREIFEDDNSVIITSNRQAWEECSPVKSAEASVPEMTAPTPRPETLIWENIGQDDTVVLDMVQAEDTPDSLPEPDQTEILSPAASFGSEEPTAQIVSPEEAYHVEEKRVQDIFSKASKQQRMSIASARESLDATVNFSQFIDIGSPMGTIDASVPNFEFDAGAKSLSHSTPTKSSKRPRECDQVEVDIEPGTPRYAQPTMASASKRRKSLPAFSFVSPIKADVRPHTADGATVPLSGANRNIGAATMDDPFRFVPTTVAPANSRPSSMVRFSAGTVPGVASTTPRVKISRPKTPSATTPRRRMKVKNGRTTTPRTIAAERYSALPFHLTRELVRDTPPQESPMASAVDVPRAANTERYPGLPSRTTYEEFAETPTVRDVSSEQVKTPRTVVKEHSPISPSKTPHEEQERTPTKSQSTTPKPTTPILSDAERYPGLPSRATYDEHARTVAAPARFRTPSQVPAKRPATAMKASSLQDLARRRARGSGTPIKTPLKPPGMTPGQAPMTPHPAAPLKGVYALVDVWTNDASPASSAFIALLQRLGAKTTKSWSKRLTHVVFKSGSPATLQRLRLHNKEAEESGGSAAAVVFCVNSRWVTDCDAEGRHVDESDEAYAVDVDEACRGSKRRRKSMEPAALVNIGNNVIRDRNSSLGRASLGRMSGKCVVSPADMSSDSSPKIASLLEEGGEDEDKENSGGQEDDSSPVTPAYLAAPNLLVQQTAPMNRVRKLALGSNDQGKSRRMTTVWDLEF